MKYAFDNRGIIRSLIAGEFLLLLLLSHLSSAQGMEVLGSLNLPNRTGVAVHDTVAFAVGSTNFTALSIARPSSPEVLGQVELGMTLHAVDVEGDYAYCAGGGSGFAVVDISDPRTPSRIHTTILTGSCVDIAVEDTILAVAIGSAVVILGVQEPSSPHILASFAHTTSSVALHWSGRRVYAGGTNGVVELDITNPRSPVRRSHFGAGLPATPIAYSSPYVDAARSATLLTLNPSPLSQAGAFQTSAGIQAVCEGGGYQTLIGMTNGDVIHIDETDMPPRQVASVNVGAQIRRIDTEEVNLEALAVVATVSGVTIVRYEPVSDTEPRQLPFFPEKFQISAYPNPFNGSVRLQFTGAKNGWHTFELFDLTGSKVAVRQVFLTSGFEFTFTPEALATGIYFARVSGNSGISQTRLIYLK